MNDFTSWTHVLIVEEGESRGWISRKQWEDQRDRDNFLDGYYLGKRHASRTRY